MLNKKEQKQILDAHKHGQKIQIKTSATGDWSDMVKPIWNFSSYEYRIRPANWKAPVTKSN